MTRGRGTAVVLVLIGVLATSCSGGDTAPATSAITAPTPTTTIAPNRAAFVGLLAESFVSEVTAESGELVVDREEATCLAEGVYAGSTEDRLRQLGYDPAAGQFPEEEDLLDAQTDVEKVHMVDLMRDCVNLVGQLTDLVLVGELTDSEEIARCAAETYTASDTFAKSVTTPEFDPELNDEIDRTLADALTDCTSRYPSADNEATDQALRPGETVSYVDYTDEEDGFSISYPEGWAAFTNPDPTGGITALFAGPGYPNGPSVHIFTNEPEPGTTLEEFVEWRINDIQAGSPGQEFIEQGATVLGDARAWFVAYEATLHPDELDLFFGEVMALHDGHGYIVTYTSPSDTWREWAGVQGPMVISFRPPTVGS